MNNYTYTIAGRPELTGPFPRPIESMSIATFPECFKEWEERADFGLPHAFGPRIIRGQSVPENLYRGTVAIMEGKKRPKREPDYSMNLGPYCSMFLRKEQGAPGPHYIAWDVVASDTVFEICSHRMVLIPDDNVSFEIHYRDNGFALVTASYRRICGSLWLALIRQDSIPSKHKL